MSAARFTGRSPASHDLAEHALDEWVLVRGSAWFGDFGPRVGMSQTSWERLFHQAAAQGDPRAVKARCA